MKIYPILFCLFFIFVQMEITAQTPTSIKNEATSKHIQLKEGVKIVPPNENYQLKGETLEYKSVNSKIIHAHSQVTYDLFLKVVKESFNTESSKLLKSEEYEINESPATLTKMKVTYMPLSLTKEAPKEETLIQYVLVVKDKKGSTQLMCAYDYQLDNILGKDVKKSLLSVIIK